MIGMRSMCAEMRTRARLRGFGQLAYPSQPALPSGPSRTVDASLAYSSTPVLGMLLRSVMRAGSTANSSAEARRSRSWGKTISSLMPRKKVAAVELRTPSFVILRAPYHQRPCAYAPQVSFLARSSPHPRIPNLDVRRGRGA